MLVLPGSAVDTALPMREAIDCVEAAYREYALGRIRAPLRTAIETAGGTMLVMPARMSSPGAAAVKVVSVVEDNPVRGLPVVLGSLLLLDDGTGRPLALMDAARVTAIRTGASGGVAARYLARPGSRVVAVIGAGVQARTQLEALACLLPLSGVRVYDVRPGQVESFIADMMPVLPGSPGIVAVSCPGEGVRGADIVVCATTSRDPVLNGDHLSPGAHVTAVGAFTPEMRELDVATLKRAGRVVVDSEEACWAEAGDLTQPAGENLVGRDIISAEIGDIVTGRHKGRVDPGEITVFKAVGLAALDVAVAAAIYERDSALGLGTEVEV